MAMDFIGLSVGMGYTDETVIGGGAIKGKNCVISNIEEVADGVNVTFQSILDDGTVKTDTVFIPKGTQGEAGVAGKSAYEIWLEAGNTGTEEDFLISLVGEKGADGTMTFEDLTEEQKAQLKGENGKSAYQIWLDAGNTGSEEDFLESLKGDGADGFSPVITENSNNTDEDYRLDIETKESKFTTPNLKADIRKNIAEHNTSLDSHNDIRIFLNELNNRLNALANSDDETLDEMKEVVAYIKDNRSLIESITTTKVNVADIIDNLITNVSNKPLSASQGVVIKNLIDTLQSELTAHINNADIHVTASDKTNWNNATDKINNLEVGGTNLLTGEYFAQENVIITDDKKVKFDYSDNINKDCYFFVNMHKNFILDKEYTISFDVENLEGEMSVYIGAHSNEVKLKNGRVSKTFIASADIINRHDNKLLIDDVKNSITSTINNVLLSNFKLEKGNVATDWTPAPEDKLDSTVINLGQLKGKTISDLQSMLSNWIIGKANIPNSRAIFYGDIHNIVNLWNSNNMTGILTSGSNITVEIDAHYVSSDYTLLKFTTYNSKEVYYVSRVNFEWKPIHKVAFTDDLTINAIQGLRAELDELRSLITNS